MRSFCATLYIRFLATVLCVPQNVASLRHAYLVSSFLDHEDVTNLSIGAIWNFGKGTGLLVPSIRVGAQRAFQA